MIKFTKAILTIGLALALPLMAQTKPVSASATPELTKVEKLALNSLQQEFSDLQKFQQKVSQDLRDFEESVEATHPGYTFNPQSGTLVTKPTTKTEKSK